jgi:hypothetical protein
MQPAEIAGTTILVVVGLAIVGLILQAFFLLLGARIAGIEGRSFWRAMGTTILGGVAATVFTAMLSVIPAVGTVLGFVGGFFASALIMMPIFRTTYGKALGATVLAWVLGSVIIGGIVLIVIVVAGTAVAPMMM